MKLRVKDWADFQHYKHRSPPWIKLHRAILDDYDFHRLPDASRALAPCLWLLASENQDGEIDADIPKLAYRFRKPEDWVKSALKPLIDSGFFIVASGVLAECLQDAMPEKSRDRDREETEGEKRRQSPSGDDPLPPFAIQWNEMARPLKLPTVKGMTAARTRFLKALLLKRSQEDLTACLTAVAASPFLTGTNDRGWRCDFDFILRPDKFQAILEGKYNGTAPVKLSPLTSAVGRLLREGAEREPVSDGAGNPYLNGNDAPAGLAHTSIRQIDAPLPAAKRPWGG